MHIATVAHFEIGARDSESLKRFYASLFGWQISREQGAHGAYRVAPNGSGIGSVITAAGHNGPIPYVEVDDVLENLCYAEELGARIIIELPHEIFSGGWCARVALFADPEGNQMGLSSGFDRRSS